MGKRKKIVARMEELYPGTEFVITSRKPLCISHNNLELCHEDSLYSDFVDICLSSIGKKKTLQSAIYYDFENN